MFPWQRSIIAAIPLFLVLFVLPVSGQAQADAIRRLVSEDYDRADNARDLAAKMRLCLSRKARRHDQLHDQLQRRSNMVIEAVP